MSASAADAPLPLKNDITRSRARVTSRTRLRSDSALLREGGKGGTTPLCSALLRVLVGRGLFGPEARLEERDSLEELPLLRGDFLEDDALRLERAEDDSELIGV